MKSAKFYFQEIQNVINEYIDYDINETEALRRAKALGFDANKDGYNFNIGNDFFKEFERDSSYADEEGSY